MVMRQKWWPSAVHQKSAYGTACEFRKINAGQTFFAAPAPEPQSSQAYTNAKSGFEHTLLGCTCPPGRERDHSEYSHHAVCGCAARREGQPRSVLNPTGELLLDPANPIEQRRNNFEDACVVALDRARFQSILSMAPFFVEPMHFLKRSMSACGTRTGGRR